MKILHVNINEYADAETFLTNLFDVDNFDQFTGVQLVSNKDEAELLIKKHYENNSKLRVFYYATEKFEGFKYFQLYECLID